MDGMTDLNPFFIGVLEELYRPVAKAFDPKEQRDEAGRWAHDPAREVRLVQIEGAPLAGAEQTKELARAWAIKHLPGTYENEATGWKVDVATKGIREGIQHLDWNSPAALQTLAAVPELIRVAVPAQTEPNKNPAQQPEIHIVHTLMAPILVKGEIRRARMTVRETNMGQKYYGHRLEGLDIEKSGAFSEGLRGDTPPTDPQHPDTVKIGALLKGFKPHKGEKP